jgi:hypothetical protein
MAIEVKTSKNGNIKLIAGADYVQEYAGKPIAKMKDTGNGVIIKFPSYSCISQDNYVCLNYAEAEYMYLLLKEVAERYQFGVEHSDVYS